MALKAAMLEPETAEFAAAAGSSERSGAVEEQRPRIAPRGATVVRHVVDARGSAVDARDAAATSGEKLIYSNTGGTLAYPPGADARVADDLATEAVGACGLTRYRVAVTGGVPGGTGAFSCTVGLWTACPPPQGTGTLIAGTESTFMGLIDDAAVIHELEVDLSAAPISIPPTVWVSVRFDTPTAAWIVGSSAETGFSGDYYHSSLLGCRSWFGGCPVCASFYTQLFAEESCETHHLAYSATAFSWRTLSLGTGIRGADDLYLTDASCELSAVEVYLRGTSGAYQVDFDFRLPGDANPISGTQRTFTSHPQAGNGSFQAARFLFPPGVDLPSAVWLAWKANRNNTGPLLAARAAIGTTDPAVYVLDLLGPGWQPYAADGVLSARVFCRGETPLGACCPSRQPGEAPECTEGVSAAHCAAGRWIQGATCGAGPGDPFDPPCGAHACCMPDGGCADLTETACAAVVAPASPPVSCLTDADCPPHRPCGADGRCTPRAGVWHPGDYCTDQLFDCPVYQCFFAQGDCFAVDVERACDDDDDCFAEQSCVLPYCRANPTMGCAADADCPPGDHCVNLGTHVCDARRGCGVLKCCDLVCRDDPFCCDIAWDENCVSRVIEVCETVPGNDVCAHASPDRGAVEIGIDPDTMRGSTVAYNQYATTGARPGDTDPPTCCSKRGSSHLAYGTLWYYFVMPFTAQGHTTARIHTCATSTSSRPLDSLVQVFSVGNESDEATACNSLQTIGCNDDYPTCGNGLSDVCVDGLEPGRKYYILLGDPIGAYGGLYRLDVEVPCTRMPPPNDDCPEAITIPQGVPEVQVPFDLTGATFDCRVSPCKLGPAVDLWYDYTASCDGAVTIETCGATPSDVDPDTTLAVYRVTDSANPCAVDGDLPIACHVDAPVSVAEHRRRSQTCASSGHCSGSPGTLCLLGDTTCPAGQTCVPTECDTDANCQPICASAGTLCGTAKDCNHCEVTHTPCERTVDCFQCGPSGAFCDPYQPNCPQGAICQYTQACVITGDRCVPERCVSSCGKAVAATFPAWVGERFLVRLGAEAGTNLAGMLGFRCEADDCQPNGVPDLLEIAEQASEDCNHNGEPDECDVATCTGDPRCRDCNANGRPDVCEIRQQTDAPGGPFYCAVNCDPDCNGNGRPDACDLEECEGDPACADCNANGVLDPCDPDCNENGRPDACDLEECVGDPACGDCNANGVPDACDEDCNGNGRVDACEAADCAGEPACRDCNRNAVPDVCEIEECGTDILCRDCNVNCNLDVCDIESGYSLDRNSNGVPDECECPIGLPRWLDPPSGVVDARQPNSVADASLAMGIDTLLVSGPPAADPGCWTLCEQFENGTPNAVVSVEEMAGTYTLHLARPITPGALTEIAYRDPSAHRTAQLFSLPGDVNGDGYPNARDVTAFVDVCLNLRRPPRWGNYSCDIDHSGAVNAADLTRLVDVLTGAGALERWLGRKIPLGGCGKECHGTATDDCPALHFCKFPRGSCGRDGVAGVCTRRDCTCPSYTGPVCGCDGGTYRNECTALREGVSIDYIGACRP